MHAYRLRADETYFDRRSHLEAKPKAALPNALADLGQFLYQQANIRHTEKVETRAEPTPYRATDADGESTTRCNAAIKCSPSTPTTSKPSPTKPAS